MKNKNLAVVTILLIVYMLADCGNNNTVSIQGDGGGLSSQLVYAY